VAEAPRRDIPRVRDVLHRDAHDQADDYRLRGDAERIYGAIDGAFGVETRPG